MKIRILTLFPEMFTGPFSESIIKRAIDAGKVDIKLINFRDFSCDKHNKVDDAPYGGGSGMVLKPEPIFDAVEFIKKDIGKDTKVVLLTPQGRSFKQNIAKEFSCLEKIIFICGHYEGFDERIRQNFVDDEISLGDFILTGGEIPAMAVVDSIVRLLPGVLGNESSHEIESFSNGLLEYAQYTRPENYKGMKVPEILLSGNHKKIEEWRLNNAKERTKKRRLENS